MLKNGICFRLLLLSFLSVSELLGQHIATSTTGLYNYFPDSISSGSSFSNTANYRTPAGSTGSQLVLSNSFPASFQQSTATNTPKIANIGLTSVFQPFITDASSSATSSASSSVTSASSSTSSATSSSASSAIASSLLSIPTFKNFLNVQIPGTEASRIFFNNILKVLSYHGHKRANDIANFVSQSAASTLDVYTLPIVVPKVASALEKFLISEGIEILPSFSQSYASNIESAVNSDNVDNIESLYQALTYGTFNFLKSIDPNLIEKADVLAQFFHAELASQ